MLRSDCLYPRKGGDETYSLTINQFTKVCYHCSRGKRPREQCFYQIRATDRDVYLICSRICPSYAWKHKVLRYNLSSRIWSEISSKKTLRRTLRFSALCNDTLFLWDRDSITFTKLPENGGDITSDDIEEMKDLPFEYEEYEDHSMVLSDPCHLYAVGGMSGRQYAMDVLALNIRSREWTQLYDFRNARDPFAPEPREVHEVIVYNDRLYIFGGDSSGNVDFCFNVLHAFNLKTSQWEIFRTIGDYPERRQGNGCVQDPCVPSIVYVNGGCNRVTFLYDTWRINLDTLTWTRIKQLDLPFGIFEHSVAISPGGRLFIHGGFEVDKHNCDSCNSSDGNYSHVWKDKYRSTPCLDIYSARIRIPSLTAACMEAIEYYYQNGVYTKMVKHWLPQKYMDWLQSIRLKSPSVHG